MRRRKLQEGSTGAELGPEGSDDASETWMVVDCMNYIVHFQDEKTRKASMKVSGRVKITVQTEYDAGRRCLVTPT
jgi:hypothetical protein